MAGLRDAIVFMDEIGIYDVVLPFLLVFVIVYAILEKTKIFGTEKVEGNEQTRKSLNAMIAFVIAFLVVASTTLVATISAFAARMVLLLIISVSFLMLYGSLTDPEKMKKGVFLEGKTKAIFLGVIAFGLVLVFLSSFTVECDSGRCNLIEVAMDFVSNNSGGSATFSTVALLIGIGLFMFWVTYGKEEKEEE